MAGGRRSNRYLNNENLINEIIKSKAKADKLAPGWRDKEAKKTVAHCLTNELITMLSMLVDRYSQKSNWRGYTYIEDMRADAVVALCQNALKFDETKYKNPFGYYTQITKHAFLTYLDKETRVRDIRDNILEANGQNPSHHRQAENERRAAMPALTVKQTAKRDKEVEKLTAKLEQFAEILPVVTKLKDVDHKLERQIGRLLGIGPGSYTSVQADAKKCLPEGYESKVEHDVEIAGIKGTVVTVAEKSGSSSTKRILQPPYPRCQIPIAITALALTLHKDTLSRRLRDLNGDKPASMYRVVPVQEAGTIVDHHRGRNLEYNEPDTAWGGFDKFKD